MLQVCNVGNVVGGTAACAWTVTRALPQVEHAVVFLSRVSEETRRAFAHCRVEQWDAVDEGRLLDFRPDVVLLHNTPPHRVGRIESAVTMQYVHSSGRRAAADVTVYCSRWLAERCGGAAGDVLYQAVPKPPQSMNGDARALRDRPVIGRICTPRAAKWPDELPGFYERLTRRFPSVEWEFVGCPDGMQPRLAESCCGRATFHAASWAARSLLWRWDVLLYHNRHVAESFGRTAAESMRAGCIPIVDAAGGFSEQAPEGGGFLCSDEDAFMTAVGRLLDAGVRRRMSRTAMRHADAVFSLERFGSALKARLAEAAR